MVKRIRALDASVVNKIAAGEIVIAPVNALKEMMENSIDAKATMVDILIKEGGMKLLQITDNGSGINKEDLPLLCERFTTSKLQTFEDLSRIQTFGFRGEALASISHIARVTVTTKTNADQCAWRVSYSEGKMLADPKPVAGKNGTIITVEDLFYNIPSRLRALRPPGEEFNKILDVVGRYSINNPSIGFSCKKFGDSKLALMIKSNSTIRDRVRVVFGANVSTKLMELNIEINPILEKSGLVSASGLVSDLDYNNKKSVAPVFFINKRLVTCDPLRRSFNQVFSTFLPKGNRPFIYMSLDIKSENVDVNIHPTKREVRFLHEEEIIDCLVIQLQEKLALIDTSRTFKSASVISRNPTQKMHSESVPVVKEMGTPIANKIKRQENKLVRTDSSQVKITNYLRSNQFEKSPSQAVRLTKRQKVERELEETHKPSESDGENAEVEQYLKDSSQHTTLRNNTYYVIPKKRVQVNLTSIKMLMENVDKHSHSELTNIFANLTYVGIVDETRRLASIQCDLKLFLIDYGSVCNELFYQIGLTDFSNFGKILLFDDDGEKGLNIKHLLHNIDNLSVHKIKEIIEKFVSMSEMLSEYFSIDVGLKNSDWETARIISVPLLLKDYNPPLSKLASVFYISRRDTGELGRRDSLFGCNIKTTCFVLYSPSH